MNEMQDSVAKTSLKEKDVKFSRLKKHFSSEIIEQRHLFREKVYHGRHLSLPRWHIFDSAKNVRDKTSGISSRRNGWSFLTASLIECHMELSNGDTYSGSKNYPYSIALSFFSVEYVCMKHPRKFLFSASCSASFFVHTQQFSGLNSLASSFSKRKEMARNCSNEQKLSIQLHFSLRNFLSRHSDELDHIPFEREKCREHASIKKQPN